MPTETLAAPAEAKPVESAAPILSLSEALDAALGDTKSVASPAQAISEQPSKEASPEAKSPEAPSKPSESKSEALDKTPSSILDQLGKIGLEGKETEAPTEKAQEEKPVEEALPDVKSPAAQTAFAKLTKELREAKAKLKDFESKVASRTEAVEDKGEDVKADSQLAEYQAKLEQFEKERDELEGELRLSKIEATREYKTAVGDPIKQTVQTITDIAKVYDLKANPILEAAQETDGAKRRVLLKELTSDMDAVDALAVRTKVDELSALNAKREEMVKESKSALEAIARREEEAEKTSRSRYDAEAKKAFGEVWDNFQEELPLLKKVEGNEQWNKTIDELRGQAEQLDSEPLDHKQRAALTYQAVTLPLVVKVFKDYVSKTNQELSSLKSNLSEYRKATPGVGSGLAPDKSEKIDSGLGFLDALEKGL
jgi:hypothetical protein